MGNSGGAQRRSHPHHPQQHPSARAHRRRQYRVADGGTLPELLDLRAEVHIHIDKQLPVQGGLGGGSANAIAALIGLEQELDRRLSPPERLRLAAEIGSDVPLFLFGGAVVGVGRGEEVFPSSRYSLVALRPGAAGNRGFYPASLPGLGQPAGRRVDRAPPQLQSRS